MERLTSRYKDMAYLKAGKGVNVSDMARAVSRLAEYEDIADSVGGIDRLRELAEQSLITNYNRGCKQ